MVLRGPHLHEQKFYADPKPHQERPEPVVQPLCPCRLRTGTVPQQVADLLQQQLYAERPEHGLLSAGARSLQPHNRGGCPWQPALPREALGRYDAQDGQHRLRGPERRVHRVLAHGPLLLREEGRHHKAEIGRRPLHQPWRNKRGHPEGRQKSIRERTAHRRQHELCGADSMGLCAQDQQHNLRIQQRGRLTREARPWPERSE